MKKRTLVISIVSILALAVTILLTPLGTPIVSAVQNIFMGLNTVKDIKYRGKNVNKVVYRGQVVWEREPDVVTISDMTYMQDLALLENAQVCADTPDRTRTTLKDRRNNQDYYVEKIGNLCWMETNLRYAGDGNYDPTWNYPDDRYATTATDATHTANPNDNIRPLTTVSGNQASSANVAQRADPGGSTDYINTTANGGFYGFLYNWCATMGGQANACNDTSTTGFDTATSICPAGWRLPTGGTATTTDWKNLTNAVGATANAAGSTNLRNNFLAVYSGTYISSLLSHGTSGFWWSSTVGDATLANSLLFTASNVNPENNSNKFNSFAVRCVL